jgi:ribonuclease PH
VTAEYSLLPGSTDRRTEREISRGKASGRTLEIQRLIGRSLRSVVDTKALGERTLWIDCDVLQADGGTRTASVTGAWTALALATWRLRRRGAIDREPLLDSIAAVSVGLVDGVPLLDLPYEEDSRAQVDMNVVATGSGRLAEIQGTGEGTTFSRAELDALTDLALRGIADLTRVQHEALRAAGALE